LSEPVLGSNSYFNPTAIRCENCCQMRHPHVLIVGAGIVGASIAWHLARAGARTTVMDARETGGVASRNSWAWINASWGNPEPYFRLRVRAMDEWRRLEQEVQNLRVAWVGSLLWELPPEQLRSFQVNHAAWGYDIRSVERAEVRRIEPHLADPPELALHAPAEGAVEPLAATQTLLAAAQILGATVIANNPVHSLNLRAGHAVGVATSAGSLDANEIVIASGIGTANLVATAGITLPITASPALLVRTQPHAKRLNGLVMSPAMQLRQTPEGRLVAAINFEHVGADADSAKAAAAALGAMKGMIISSKSLVLESHVVGVRPMPMDGFPAVGRAADISGLYVAVMHSGITLAPAIGRFVADEILTGRRDNLIEPYGLDRFS
jgi:glycine/D-amino acid oxidase-like deaminating enzyme